jgi:hypothetical protein
VLRRFEQTGMALSLGSLSMRSRALAFRTRRCDLPYPEPVEAIRGLLPIGGAHAAGLSIRQFIRGLERMPMALDANASVISDDSDIYGTVADIGSRR